MSNEGGKGLSDADKLRAALKTAIKKEKARAKAKAELKSKEPKLKKGGAAKRQVGGTTQGYNARLDERLGMTGRPRSATGQTYAQRRAESRGARTPAGSFGFTAKKGGAAKRKKGGTVKRSRGGTAKKK
jgi:hypothetical protein